MRSELSKGCMNSMVEWQITDSEIQDLERLLLPKDCHFADDALQVIRYWNSVDVSACPGSGKTTLLLAKLKLLADRMPLNNGAGVCVLSHTNVAVNEIKEKLAEYADKLMSYPNFVGTIQSFIDRFVTMPYIRQIAGQPVQPVDNITYAQHVLSRVNCGRYSQLNYVIRKNYESSGNKIYASRVEHAAALYLHNDNSLCIRSQKKPLAGAGKTSAVQFINLKQELLEKEGIITYSDAYRYANKALEELSEQYIELFNKRFLYVFIDEYQDCDNMQRNALNTLFDPAKCVVVHIGDPDQAIYKSEKESINDWQPLEGFLSISHSNRYNQKIADFLTPLRKDGIGIKSALEREGLNPVLIIFDHESIEKVLETFVTILEERGLHNPDGIYKAIGFVKSEDSAGIKISSYWEEFDGVTSQNSEYKYWKIVHEISSQLRQGKLYRTEQLVRKLICRLYHYAGKKDVKSGKDYTLLSIRDILKESSKNKYAEHILSLAELNNFTPESVDVSIRSIIDDLWNTEKQDNESVFDIVPKHFMEAIEPDQKVKADKNVFRDPLRGRRIQFDTVHGVKGETHDATLYLETELSGGSDIGRVLCRYGIGKAGKPAIFDYSRKIVYVGMSRPSKLLCLAIKGKTYEKGQKAFEAWDKIDIRN